MIDNPTMQVYSELQQAYAYFNTELFDGKLPPCILTLHRHKNTYGYFINSKYGKRQIDEAFEQGVATLDEIALNPDHLISRTDIESLSTLVHEQCHLWQQHFGRPPRRAYHDKQWAHKMREVGLIPSTTGAPGGKETGQKVSHYIEESGAFSAACEALLKAGFTLSWGSFPAAPKETKSGKRAKFVCPSCEGQAWGKESLYLICGECNEDMELTS